MARVLNTTQISFAICKIIKEAQERVCIITPYISLQTWRHEWSSVMEALIDASKRNVHVIIICRSFNHEIENTSNDKYVDSLRKQQDKQLEAIEKMKEIMFNSEELLHIHYCPYLHAKCYFNEKDTIIPSMNLTMSSLANENKELGILLKKGEDDELLRQLHLYINDICKICRPKITYINPQGEFKKRRRKLEKYGHCIYCGREIAFSEEEYICSSCKPEIERGYQPPKRYCHLCGESATYKEVRPGHPFHYNCWKSLQ